MAKYGVNYYGSSKYGSTPLLRFSVQPMSVLVSSAISTDFRKATVTWQSPSGTFSRFRLVRNQAGFPETAEDGIIIFDEIASEGTVSRSYFIDGEDNPGDIPLVPGRQVYYRVFLFTDSSIWVNAGSITAIIPSNHGTQKQMMNMLPRVYTSKEQSPLGVVDETSALYDFIFGLSFTQEELYTLIDLLRPRHTGLETPFELIPAERTNVGLRAEPGLPTKNQKRLIREALYMYSNKGTMNAIETYAEALTGFAPTITVSQNLLLTVQDSTFYNSTGNWVFTNATAEANTEQVPATGDNVIDTFYTCEVTASNSFSMTLGEDNPIGKGVPVNPDTEYIASFKVKSPPSDGSVSITIGWYDRTGTLLDTDSSSLVSANNTWKTVSVTATSPADASYAGLQISSNADGQYYIDQVCMQLGDTVIYDEARAVDIFLEPTKTNFIKNPSFEIDDSSWTITASNVYLLEEDVPVTASSGTYSVKVDDSTGATFETQTDVGITQRDTYATLSFYAKSTIAGEGLTATLTAKDDLGSGEIVGVEEFQLTTDWTRYSVTIYVNDSDVPALPDGDLYFMVNIVTDPTVSNFVYLDDVQLELSPKATDFFDGNLPSNFGAVWQGTENDSYTHLYPNKPSKIPRLGKTLNDWLPQNTFWRLRTYDGVEYTTTTV